MPTAPHDTEYYLDTASELASRVAANVDRIEADRQLPTELANEIADNGFYRLLVPRSLGGAELDHPTYRKILEIIATAVGSTAWCINQNIVFASDCVRIPEQTA